MDTGMTRRLIAGCWREEVPLDRHLFELRVGRAKTLLPSYRIALMHDDDECAVFEVLGGADPYLVYLDKLTVSGGHFCSCPDGAKRVICYAYAGSLCKHLIAVLFDKERAHMLAPVLAGLSGPPRRRPPRPRGPVLRGGLP